MCVAIPARVKSIQGTRAVVEAHGEKEVLCPFQVQPGDYILYTIGTAVEKIDEAEYSRLKSLME